MSIQHDVKKSLEWCVFTGILLLLQLSCLLTLLVESSYQFWQGFSNMVVCTYVQIKNVLIWQDEVILLLFLLRLLCIIICTHFWYLVYMGLIPLLFALRIAAFLSHFFIFRHSRTLWTGITLVGKALTITFLYLLEHEENIFPLVRAALYVAKYIIIFLISCLRDGMLACGAYDGKRLLIFVGNPAFGGRGPGIVRNKGNNKNKTFDSTLGFPGEGWAPLRFATWNTRGLTFQRFKFCQQLGYDVLCLTELWRGQSKYLTKGKRFITPEPILI